MAKWIPLRISGAARWMACPGSATASSAVKDTSNKAADRGTVAHAVLEIALRLDIDTDELEARFLGKLLKNLPQVHVDEEMLKGVGHALDYVRGYLAQNKGADFHAETGVDLSSIVDNRPLTGTSDIVIDNGDEIVVVDYKNGVMHVDVEDNAQLLGYALGYVVRTSKRRKRVRLVIVQPNAEGRAPIVSQVITWDDLMAFQAKLQDAVKDVHAKSPVRESGSHCKWCPAAGNCKEYANRALQVARMDFQSLDETHEIQELYGMDFNISDEELANILKNRDFFRTWLSACEAEGIERMTAKPRSVPGFKLVCSTPHRRWTDEERVVQAIRAIGAMSELTVIKPLPPGQMEKKLTAKRKPSKYAKYWENFRKAVTRNPVEPRIGTMDDTRQDWQRGIEFGDEE